MLDVLRYPAAFSIVGYHALLTLRANGVTSGAVAGLAWIEHVATLCVSFFFFLSGYGVHLSTLRVQGGESRQIRGRFRGSVARVWRLYPMYLAAIVVCLGSNALFEIAKGRDLWAIMPEPRDLLYHLLLVHTLSADTFFGVIPSLWFIGVLAHLLLLYPGFLWMVERKGIAFGVAVVFGISALFMGCAGASRGGWALVLGMNAPSQWFAWCIGAYVADLIFKARRPNIPEMVTCILGICTLLLFGASSIARMHFEVVVMGGVLWGGIRVTGGSTNSRVLLWLARSSGVTYGVYLLHQIFIPRIGVFFGSWNELPLIYWGLCTVVCLTVTLPVACLIQRFASSTQRRVS